MRDGNNLLYLAEKHIDSDPNSGLLVFFHVRLMTCFPWRKRSTWRSVLWRPVRTMPLRSVRSSPRSRRPLITSPCTPSPTFHSGSLVSTKRLVATTCSTECLTLFLSSGLHMSCMAQRFPRVYGMLKDILLDFRFSVHFCVEQVSRKEAFWLVKSSFRAVLNRSSNNSKSFLGSCSQGRG